MTDLEEQGHDCKGGCQQVCPRRRSLVIGNYTVGTCAELVFEVTRQKRKGLTLYSQSGSLMWRFWWAEGASISSFLPMSTGQAEKKVLRSGTCHKCRSLQMEDYTNFQYNARMEPGTRFFLYASSGSRHDDRSVQEAHIHGRRQVQNYNLPLYWQEDPHRPCSQP